MAGLKKLRRQLARKVIDGKLTVPEAHARLGREAARRAGRSGGNAHPAAPGYQPGREDKYLRSAFRDPAPAPAVARVQKAAAASAQRQYDRDMAPMREFIGRALAPAPVLPAPRPPGPAVKQLTQPERATVAWLRQELGWVAHDPVRREEIRARIVRMTGDPFTQGAV